MRVSIQSRLGMSMVMALLSLFALPGCEKLHNSTTQELIQKAKDYQAKGELRTSIIELKTALQKSPENAEARWLLGQVYVADKQGAEAEKELQKAKQLGINEESIKPFLGQAILLQGSYKRVLDEVSVTAQSSQKNAAKIQQIRGEAQLGLGNLEEGCMLFNQSHQSDASYVPAYRGIAKCLVARSDIAGAKAQLNAALKLNSKDADTWVLLGDIEGFTNNQQAAEFAYLNAKKANANNLGAYLGMVSVYSEKGQFEKAANEVSAARKKWPNSILVWYRQAFVSFQQKKYSEAQEELQQVLRVVPDHMPSVLLSGVVAFSLGSNEQAEADLGKFLNQFPNNTYARKLLAATLLKTKQSERALNTLKPALTTEIKDPQLFALAGEIYMAMNDYGKATEYFEKSTAIDPKNIALRTKLGASLLAKGETEHAVAELESAAENDPKQYSADIMLAMSYLGKNEFDKSLQAIAALEKKQPENPITFNLKGAAYLGKNDTTNARKNFEHALVLQPNYVPAAMNLAQLDLIDKKPEVARKRFEAILAKDKNNQQVMLTLAGLAASGGQEQEYVSWLEKAIKANPSVLKPRTLMANYYLQKKEPQKALMQAREAQTANPMNPDALDLLGSIQFATGEKDNALATYNQLVGVAPQSPLAHFKLASVLATMQNFDAAKISLHKALALKPDYLEAHVALISLEVKAGRYEGALKIARLVQVQHPKSPIGFSLEGDVLMQQKQYSQAAKIYNKAFSLGKSGLIAITMHQAESLSGNVKNADIQLQQWLKEQPNDMTSRAYLADSYMKRGQNKPAIEQYQVLLVNEPNNVLALNNLAWLYLQEKDSRALATVEQAYKLKPDASAVMDTLGWMLVQQGNTARGMALLQRALAQSPEIPEIRYHYAFALAKSGDKAKALHELEKLKGAAFSQDQEAQTLLKKLKDSSR